MKALNLEEQYYAPAISKSIANGASASFEFRGLSGALYAANRITIGCSDPAALNEITATVRTKDKTTVYFSDVNLLTIKRLFEEMSLMGSINITPSRALEIVVTNNSGGTETVNIRLNGYDVVQYENKLAQYKSTGNTWPKPEFGFVEGTIIASADEQSLSINLPAVDVWLNRIAIASEDDDDLQVSFVVNNEEIIPAAFVSQLNDEFSDKGIITPVFLEKNIPFEARVSNLNGASTRDISILCECYRV